MSQEKSEEKRRRPSCKAVTLVKDWQAGESYCEDCGSHPAIICPSCGEDFDTVYIELGNFEVEDE